MSTYNKFRRALGITEKGRGGIAACVVCHSLIIRYPCYDCTVREREEALRKRARGVIIRCATCDTRYDWTEGHLFRCCRGYATPKASPTGALVFHPAHGLISMAKFETDNEQRMLDIKCTGCAKITHWTGNANGPKFSCCVIFGVVPPGTARHGALLEWIPADKKFTITRDGPIRRGAPQMCPCGKIGTVYSTGDTYQRSTFVCAECDAGRKEAAAERAAWRARQQQEQRARANEEWLAKLSEERAQRIRAEEFRKELDKLPKTYQCGGCGLCTPRPNACEDCRELCKKCGKLASLRIPKIYTRELLCERCNHEHDGECHADVETTQHFTRQSTVRRSTYTWGSRAAPSGGLYYNYGPEVSYVDTPVEEHFTRVVTKKCPCDLPVKVARWECDHEAWG